MDKHTRYTALDLKNALCSAHLAIKILQGGKLYDRKCTIKELDDEKIADKIEYLYHLIDMLTWREE